jgi:hypothetical protein
MIPMPAMHASIASKGSEHISKKVTSIMIAPFPTNFLREVDRASSMPMGFEACKIDVNPYHI